MFPIRNAAITILSALTTTVLATVATPAIAEMPEGVRSMTDLLKPGAGAHSQDTSKTCAIQIESAANPCKDAWFLQLNDSPKAVAIQFNKGTSEYPLITFLGDDAGNGAIAINGVILRNGGQSTAKEDFDATGYCLLGKTAMNCAALTKTGRLLTGMIVEK
jgi:hypothetical protein